MKVIQYIYMSNIKTYNNINFISPLSNKHGNIEENKKQSVNNNDKNMTNLLEKESHYVEFEFDNGEVLILPIMFDDK